jgi:hypothetical protein
MTSFRGRKGQLLASASFGAILFFCQPLDSNYSILFSYDRPIKVVFYLILNIFLLRQASSKAGRIGSTACGIAFTLLL